MPHYSRYFYESVNLQNTCPSLFSELAKTLFCSVIITERNKLDQDLRKFGIIFLKTEKFIEEVTLGSEEVKLTKIEAIC